MNFASDNWSGVAPQVSQALASHSSQGAPAYGDSELDKKVREKFNDIFEKEVAVFFVGTGTIANSLAIASVSKPGGIALCHEEAHMVEDECGGPELFSGGGRLARINGDFGKIDLNNLKSNLERFDPDFVHYGQCTAVSLTQATEVGTVYSLDEIREISALTKSHSLPFHMDGSRFANALVHLDTTPAEMSWKSGVDILSFGGTKNGCWCAEAIVLFDLDLAQQMSYAHKRAGQLYSKSRFISAQYEAYFENNLWLELATHANSMADKLREKISKSQTARLGWPTQSNEVFCVLPTKTMQKLKSEGATFHPWRPPLAMENKPQESETLCRFVTSFATSNAEITQLTHLL